MRRKNAAGDDLDDERGGADDTLHHDQKPQGRFARHRLSFSSGS
jgi:hypothetical protein